ncbi:hypothetical protein EON63_07555, partial [archaeon]
MMIVYNYGVYANLIPTHYILQVKNYKTPDAFAYFYQKVALSMNSYDVYPLLLPELKTTLSSTGG